MKLSEIPTPALLIDVAAMQRNIERMAEFFAEGQCKLRPHSKAHKTPEIARRQLAAGLPLVPQRSEPGQGLRGEARDAGGARALPDLHGR